MSRKPAKRDVLARLRRQLAIAADAGKPRRVRTRAARYAASLAEQAGLVRRWRICEWCRRSGRLARHHWNYDEPLVVTYLCGDCHEVADAMAG